jgi:hypothetical protein
MADKYRCVTLAENDYDCWNNFVDISPQGCIFCKTWWLDAVSPGRYSIFCVYKGENLVGGLPVVHILGRGNRITGFGMTPLTQTLGVLLPPSDRPYSERISEEKRIIDGLVAALGDTANFGQNFHYNFQNWLPFMWRGYSQTSRYTYVLEGIKDEASIWKGMAKGVKSDVNKAKKLGLEVEVDSRSQTDFWDVYLKAFARQKMSAPVSFDFFSRLDHQMEKMGKRKMLFIVAPDQQIHAVIYIIIDNSYAYYLMGGADPALRRSGATAFGIFEAIKIVSGEADTFDFEGSVVKNIETFFRGFGGYQRSYFQIIRRVSKFQQVKKEIKNLLIREQRR